MARTPQIVTAIQLDAELVGYVLERRAALMALKEVIRRVGPSTPHRQKVNTDRANRRRVFRETVGLLEAKIVKRCDELVPHHDQPDDL